MFLLHKTRWEVFFGRNSGMYVRSNVCVLKKGKTFGVLNGLLYLSTQVYWIRVKAHLLNLSMDFWPISHITLF